MSAFIVSTDCMDRVVHGFVLGLSRSLSDELRNETGRRFFDLNIEALRQRYGSADDMMPEDWRPQDYTYSEPPAVPDCPPLVDSLKAIHCLRYQCTEGDVPLHKLYALLTNAGETLKRKIQTELRMFGEIENTPEYQRASWG
jgi:hypothetical protein